MIINNKGDIVPSKIGDNVNYKNSYCWNYVSSDIHTTFCGGRCSDASNCGLLYNAFNVASFAESASGFVKVTILDN